MQGYLDAEEYQYIKLTKTFCLSNVKFELPDELRALMLLNRSTISEGDRPHLLMQTGGYDYQMLKEVILKSYSQRKVHHSSRSPWKGKNSHSAWSAEDESWVIIMHTSPVFRSPK